MFWVEYPSLYELARIFSEISEPKYMAVDSELPDAQPYLCWKSMYGDSTALRAVLQQFSTSLVNCWFLVTHIASCFWRVAQFWRAIASLSVCVEV